MCVWVFKFFDSEIKSKFRKKISPKMIIQYFLMLMVDASLNNRSFKITRLFPINYTFFLLDPLTIKTIFQEVNFLKSLFLPLFFFYFTFKKVINN